LQKRRTLVTTIIVEMLDNDPRAPFQGFQDGGPRQHRRSYDRWRKVLPHGVDLGQLTVICILGTDQNQFDIPAAE
jgi:hypothetical protein